MFVETKKKNGDMLALMMARMEADIRVGVIQIILAGVSKM